ncbi:carbohydrate kinase family protein [Streptococcus catagoni]|uniref:carbohydrate kinase family protein n=1 Tax=Streptococcus catagoni TaxID=2654874 RepID=UPI00140A2A07|nr:carbohydrate kinase family protein [Streptococcus catagoni]
MVEDPYVVIVGGLNLDIAGLSGQSYRDHDSNIGHIKTSVGGVGHNIAINLRKYEVPTYLITVYGDDSFGKILERECQENKIHLDYAQRLAGQPSSTYLYVTDAKGDMVTAINDMTIVEHITPAFLEDKLDFINQAKICVIDANLSEETIHWLAQRVQVPIFAEPVSCAKSPRLKQVLPYIDTFKPNAYEAATLTGIKVVDDRTALEAAKLLREEGVKNVFISLGSRGILGLNKEGYLISRPFVSKLVSTNGAGDCTMATLIWARFNFGNELSIEEVNQFTQAAAKITVESEEAVSPDLSVRKLIKVARENI